MPFFLSVCSKYTSSRYSANTDKYKILFVQLRKSLNYMARKEFGFIFPQYMCHYFFKSSQLWTLHIRRWFSHSLITLFLLHPHSYLSSHWFLLFKSFPSHCVFNHPQFNTSLTFMQIRSILLLKRKRMAILIYCTFVKYI